jgi:hypothetical protein
VAVATTLFVGPIIAIYLLPVVAVAVPLLALALPYILLRHVPAEPAGAGEPALRARAVPIVHRQIRA